MSFTSLSLQLILLIKTQKNRIVERNVRPKTGVCKERWKNHRLLEVEVEEKTWAPGPPRRSTLVWRYLGEVFALGRSGRFRRGYCRRL